MPPPVKNFPEHFWSKIDRSGGPDSCWPWKAYRTIDGYGQIGRFQRILRAHRVAWELTNGPIPPNIFVCHRCDNPPCCNPAHLFLGSVQENNLDMARKGRVHLSGYPKHVKPRQKKFTGEEIAVIQEQYATGQYSQRQLASQHHVSQHTICRALGRTK